MQPRHRPRRGRPGRRPRPLLSSAAFCALLVAALAYGGAVVKPQRVGDAGGAAWGPFLSQRRDSIDVIFFGNSHVFDGVDPAGLWRTAGISSFVHGGPAQRLQVARYYVLESMRTQDPEVVAIEMSALRYSPGSSNRKLHQVNVGYMPMSVNRVRAAFEATPRGDRLGVLLDLWAYHSRWTRLTRRDFDVFGKNLDTAYLKGFVPQFRRRRVAASPYVMTAEERREADIGVDHHLRYLREIVKTCREEGAQVLLFLTPTGSPNRYTYHLERAFEALRGEFDNVRMLDLSEPGAVAGLSYESDFYDAGHLRHSGADKTSATLARYLSRAYGLPGHRSEPEYASWDEDAARRDGLIARRGRPREAAVTPSGRPVSSRRP